VILAVGVSVLEAVGALLIFTIVNLTTNPEASLALPIIGEIRDYLPNMDRRQFFLSILAFTAVFFLIRSAALLIQSYVQNRVAWSAGVRLSERLIQGYLAMPYAFHLQRNSADLIRNSYETVNDVVSFILVPGVLMTSEMLVALALLSILLLAAPVPTLLALGSFGILIVVLIKAVQPRLQRFGNLSQVAAARTYRAIQQSLHGIREIRVLGREPFFQADFMKHRRDTARAKIAHAIYLDVPRIALETAIVMVLVGLLAVTVTRGGAQETLSLLGLFAYAVLRLMPSVNRVLVSANNFKYGFAALEIATRELAFVEPYLDPPGAAREGSTVSTLKLSHEIQLAGVSFRYSEDAPLVVSDVDLRIRRGQSVGFVGPTGGGKSTLIDLILGLLVPTIGAIGVDDVDIQTDVRGWQANLGVVHQSVFLVDDSLRRNIALGIDDEDIDPEAVSEALALAHLEEVVRALPQGLDTVVGERGVRLSGGQRQRVAIARALYHRPSVLVFDEGTSALDNVTEAAIIEALTRLRGDHTILTVAHRLSTVRSCDWIAVLEGGRVTSTGTFDELLESSPSFRQMVR
jgi:ATP-binding cassette subfamily C protein